MIALVSAKGSPGVTVSGLALTLTWPRRCLFAECDPAGGDVMAGYLGGALDARRGLAELAVAELRGRLREEFERQLVDLDAPRRQRLLLPGLRDPAQSATVAPVWHAMADHFLATGQDGYDVIADCGRLSAPHFGWPIVTSADAVLLVVRGTLPSISHAVPAISALRRALASAAPRTGGLGAGVGSATRTVAGGPVGGTGSATALPGGGSTSGLPGGPQTTAQPALGPAGGHPAGGYAAGGYPAGGYPAGAFANGLPATGASVPGPVPSGYGNNGYPTNGHFGNGYAPSGPQAGVGHPGVGGTGGDRTDAGRPGSTLSGLGAGDARQVPDGAPAGLPPAHPTASHGAHQLGGPPSHGTALQRPAGIEPAVEVPPAERIGLLVVDSGPYRPDDVARRLGLSLVGVLPHDPACARSLSFGGSVHKRRPLMRSASALGPYLIQALREVSHVA